MRMLEQSLNRLQTDHLDLWQIHGVTFDNDPEAFHSSRRRGRSAAKSERTRESALRRLSPDTKTRRIHLKMLDTGFPFDSVQMPLNAFDANFPQLRNASAAGIESPRDRRAGHETDQWSRRGCHERRDHRRASVALRDELAGDSDDHRNGIAGNPAPEFKNRAGFPPAVTTRICRRSATK